MGEVGRVQGRSDDNQNTRNIFDRFVAWDRQQAGGRVIANWLDEQSGHDNLSRLWNGVLSYNPRDTINKMGR